MHPRVQLLPRRTMRSGVGAMRSMNAPGSDSEYISSDRSVISLRHFLNRHLSCSGAFLPMKKSHASALACEAAPPAAGSTTIGTIFESVLSTIDYFRA
ncbi:MAG: hypothetical protein DME84_01560 [Verrucomicrobia bacterium]|nr:MAG: hypothetical protein DME84_01560 [Verrucomicrobiota bacterium]